MKYELCADESWTHGSSPPNRRWCFLGGLFGLEDDVDRLETRLAEVLAKHGQTREVKYTSISAQNIDCYEEFATALMEQVDAGRVCYRQLHLDRRYVRVTDEFDEEYDSLGVQFRVYYQFLKHSFGLRHLPPGPHELLLRLDGHSSHQHKDSLAKFAGRVGELLGRDDLLLKVAFVRSSRFRRIQACDLVIGCAGFKGNKHELLREGGRRGMSTKQKLRLRLAKHIYAKLREISMKDRGSKAFDWFASTGRDHDPTTLRSHKVRVWAFRPSRYQIDAGWENDHLDSQGRYQGSDILPHIWGADG